MSMNDENILRSQDQRNDPDIEKKAREIIAREENNSKEKENQFKKGAYRIKFVFSIVGFIISVLGIIGTLFVWYFINEPALNAMMLGLLIPSFCVWEKSSEFLSRYLIEKQKTLGYIIPIIFLLGVLTFFTIASHGQLRVIIITVIVGVGCIIGTGFFLYNKRMK